MPEALLNFVAMLGWNPKGDQEVYSIGELIKLFELESINKAGAVFNKEKLYWMNGEYIRKKPLNELTKLCIPYLMEAELISERQKAKKQYIITATGQEIGVDWLKKIIATERERMKRLDEIPQFSAFFFKNKLEYDKETLIWKETDAKETKRSLECLIEYLTNFKEKDFAKENLEQKIKEFLGQRGIAAGNALWPMRVALSGLKASPSPFEIAEVLGKEKTLSRLKDALQKF